MGLADPADIWANARRALLPPPVEPLREWIPRNVVIPAGDSAQPGRMELWPFWNGPCDALDDPEIRRVTICKGARIGYTQWVIAVIGSYVANQPCPILAVQPRQDDARDFAVTVEGVFTASPGLRGIWGDGVDESGRSTLLNKLFPGGRAWFRNASPAGLRRLTARVAIGDEIDAMETTAEGNPVDLLAMRTLTYPDNKIILGSTPIFDHGPVSTLYEQSDKRIYEVPCPECGDFHEIQWTNIHWQPDRPETAAWCCPSCGCLTEERHKPEMVANGRWRATAPDVKGHAGFRVNCLISPHANARWGVLAAEFLRAGKNPALLQPFTNLILGQPWRTDGDVLDDGDVASRREAFGLDAIPAEVLVITAGADVQRDRVELATVGFDAEGGIYVLAHDVVWGDPMQPETWRDVDGMLLRRWAHPGGGTIGLDATLVDAGDGVTSEAVTAFTRARGGRRIFACKGVGGLARPPVAPSKTASNVRLQIVGVDGIKTRLYGAITAGSGIRFAADLSAEWFRQLLSERRIVKYSRGRPEVRFERIPGREAEALDCVTYAIAARSVVALNLAAREMELSSPAAPVARPMVSRSRWLDRF